jgi:hypothetical protein
VEAPRRRRRQWGVGGKKIRCSAPPGARGNALLIEATAGPLTGGRRTGARRPASKAAAKAPHSRPTGKGVFYVFAVPCRGHSEKPQKRVLCLQ